MTAYSATVRAADPQNQDRSQRCEFLILCPRRTETFTECGNALPYLICLFPKYLLGAFFQFPFSESRHLKSCTFAGSVNSTSEELTLCRMDPRMRREDLIKRGQRPP